MNRIIGPGESGAPISNENIIEAIREKRVMCVIVELQNGVAFHTADNLTLEGTQILLEVLEAGLEQLRATLRPAGRTQ